MEDLLQWFERWNVPLFKLGNADITLWRLVTILLAITALWIVTRWMHRWMVGRLLGRTHLDLGTRQTVAALTRYVVLTSGVMIILQTAGIDLTTFNVVAGAVGVGVGFGLQNVVSNFICGLIVMFERPIKIGDRIEVAGVEGDVIDIGARSTKVLTSEGIVVIVPNQKLIIENVRNWEDAAQRTPLQLVLRVSLDTDPQRVEEIVKDSIASNPSVLRQPEPSLSLVNLAGGAQEYKLQAWTSATALERMRIVHELYVALKEKLTMHEVKLV